MRSELEARGLTGGLEGADGMNYDVASDEAAAEAPDTAGNDGIERDDDAVREEVRRAVEAARREMEQGAASPGESLFAAFQAPKPAAERPGEAKKVSFADWPSLSDYIASPPVIVLKDVEGRVELAHVYETLNRANCGESAALLNYTPHSVTIGLPMRVPVPSKELLSGAVESVFGRACRVESDGVRISVDIGVKLEKSEDAA